MTYLVEITAHAERQLKKLSPDTQTRIRDRIAALAELPRPPGLKRLHAPVDLYRVRVGAYRIVYEIRDAVLLVLVVRIGDRKEVYREF